jgi:hypothetical protein
VATKNDGPCLRHFPQPPKNARGIRQFGFRESARKISEVGTVVFGTVVFKLDTTQIYTRVSIEKLKAVHSQTHPAFW